MSLINLNTVTMNVFSNKFLAKKALEWNFLAEKKLIKNHLTIKILRGNI
jgi:hypothetical protein